MKASELAGKDWYVPEPTFDINGDPIWRVEDRNTGETVAIVCGDFAESFAALPKLVKVIKLAIQCGENEYVETELDDALAALEAN